MGDDSSASSTNSVTSEEPSEFVVANADKDDDLSTLVSTIATESRKSNKHNFPSLEPNSTYMKAVELKVINFNDNRSDAQIAVDKHERLLPLPDGSKWDFFDGGLDTIAKEKTVKLIPCDYFTTNSSISTLTCNSRATHLGLSKFDPQILAMARYEIEMDRTRAIDVGLNALEKLIVKLGEIYKIKTKNGGTCKNARSICEAFGKITADFQAEPFWQVYYGMFDRFKKPSWQSRLEQLILHVMGWQYDPSMLAIRGKTKCCCYRLSSECMNLLRKQLSSYGKRNCGMYLTIKRESDTINDKNRFAKRIPGTFSRDYVRKVRTKMNYCLYYYRLLLFLHYISLDVSQVRETPCGKNKESNKRKELMFTDQNNQENLKRMERKATAVSNKRIQQECKEGVNETTVVYQVDEDNSFLPLFDFENSDDQIRINDTSLIPVEIAPVRKHSEDSRMKQDSNESEILRLKKELDELRKLQSNQNNLLKVASKKKQEEERSRRIEDAKRKDGHRKNSKPQGKNREESSEIKQKKAPKNNCEPFQVKHKSTEEKRIVKNKREKCKQKGKGIEKKLKNVDGLPVIVWDIKEDDSRITSEYTPPNFIEDSNDAPTAIENHRKAAGTTGELLVTWKSACRLWSPIDCIYMDEENLTQKYMQEQNLTEENMGFKIKKKKKKCKDKEYEDDENLQTCLMNHDDYLNYEKEYRPAYCNYGSFFYGIHCCYGTCNKIFSGKKDSEGFDGK